MQAEFDTVAQWTAQVAVELGTDYFIPAACRGSGSPATLRWLIDRLGISRTDLMLDCGAGVGGPAAFAAQLTGVTPVLSEPETGACRAARRLFRFPVVQAGSELPFRSEAFTVVWSLGVLCTVQDQMQFLHQIRRVMTGTGRLGLLVFVANGELPRQAPEGNNFPSWDRLQKLLAATGFIVDMAASEADFAAAPADWQERVDAVHTELDRRHFDDERWTAAAEQSEAIGTLLTQRNVIGTMIVARPAP